MAELLVVIGVIAISASLLLSAIARARMSAQSAQCLSNLHSISQGFLQYAMDNDQYYPDPHAAAQSWESLLQPYLSQPLTFACPADAEVFPAVGSSYDWRDTSDSSTTLAGRRLIDVMRPEAVLAFETLPGWHGEHLMNAVLVSGAAGVMRDDECLRDLQAPIAALPPQTGIPASQQ